MSDEHYLRREFYQQASRDPEIIDFLHSACLDGTWYWDLEKPEQAWMNDRFWDVLGYDPASKEHLASEWQHIIHPDDLRMIREDLDECYPVPNRPVDKDLRYTHKDGSTVWVRCRCVVIRDQDGKPIRMLGVHHDLTELKRAGEEASRQASQLATVNRELEGFSYSISHDLRAPLRAVDGYSRMLLEDYGAHLDNEGQRMLGLIRSESQRMSALIGTILTYSRLSRQKIEAEPIDMRDLAQEVFDELAALESNRQIRLDLRPLPMAHGGRAMIRQVWVNLICNAIKFTKERAVADIEIGTRAGEDGTPVYYVSDNGVGFDPSHVERLFSMFQHLHTTEDYPGIGAGLAIVKRIVQRHEGRAWAEGKVDHGAAFYFTIPQSKL